MRTRRIRQILFVAIVMACAVPVDIAWAQAAAQKRVLVLHSTRRDAQIALAGDRELPRLLDAGLGQSVDYYSEHLDLARFPDATYQQELSNFLRTKYAGRSFDLVIAIRDFSYDFVASHRQELFPDTPIVFLTMSTSARRLPNSTGVMARPDLISTLTLASDLQPEVKQVFVISGTAIPDRDYETQFRVQLQSIEVPFTVTYLSGLPTRELETRLRSLPDRSIVYYLLVSQDGAGEVFRPLEYLDRVLAASNAPTYSWTGPAMGQGIVGGDLVDLNAMMDALAKQAVRVLRGERADAIPTTTPNLAVRQVDWRQLQRWDIPDAHVPSGTVVAFREPTMWDRYRTSLTVLGLLLLAQTALIGALLVQRSRRRRAEDETRRSQAKLMHSYERIRDLGARLLSAQETERSRIARELHDDISQQITMLTIDLSVLDRPGAWQGERSARHVLSRAQIIAESVRNLSHRLHPAKLRLIGLVGALESLPRELTSSDMQISFVHNDVPAGLPTDLTVSLFRIAQEALQNAVKYSQARTVSMHLRGHGQRLVLTIADDGIGFEVQKAWDKGLGLISMRERLEAIGGTFEIHSSPGVGTRLEATVPLAAQSSERAVG